ncbi:MAG: hypothetical protein OEZ43_12100 [Gammaproteobacteria bacterium]|nr:hypothetical protein [Gammaproteobacteria bacterium]
MFRKRTPWYILLLFSLPLSSHARLDEPGWIFTPTMGRSGPQLKALNDGLFKMPLVGQSEITTDLPEDIEGASSYPPKGFNITNPLDPVPVWWEAGLEIRRNFGKKNDFVIGFGIWEVNSFSPNLDVTFPLQGEPENEALYSRRAKFSYTQYYVGLRRYFLERSSRFNLYIDTAIHDLFDIDYKDVHKIFFVSGAPAGFSRNIVFETQATGLLLLQFGLGAEARLADRFSISLSGSYALGVKNATLKGITTKHDFNNGDRLLSAPTPMLVNRDGYIEYLLPDGVNRRLATFRLDGWRAQLKFNIGF